MKILQFREKKKKNLTKDFEKEKTGQQRDAEMNVG